VCGAQNIYNFDTVNCLGVNHHVTDGQTDGRTDKHN